MSEKQSEERQPKYSMDQKIDEYFLQNEDFFARVPFSWKNREEWISDLKDGHSSPFEPHKIRALGTERELLCFRSEKMNESQVKENEALAAAEKNFIDQAIEWVMLSIRNAVNNRADSCHYRSYSKALGVPLFKYCGRGSRLVITKLPLNTFDVNFMVDCFNLVGDGDFSVDRDGNECDRWYQEMIDATIPMKYMASAGKLKESCWDQLRPVLARFQDDDGIPLVDVYDVDVEFTGFTADISTIPRDNNLNGFFYHLGEETFKVVASYQKDLEVISTRSCPHYVIDDQDAIDLLRFLYILCIAGFETEHSRIWEAYKSGELEIGAFSPQSEKGLDFVYREYLCSREKTDRSMDYNIENSKKGSFIWKELNAKFEAWTYKHLFEKTGSPWALPRSPREEQTREEITKLFCNLKNEKAYEYIQVKPFQNDALFHKLMALFQQQD